VQAAFGGAAGSGIATGFYSHQAGSSQASQQPLQWFAFFSFGIVVRARDSDISQRASHVISPLHMFSSASPPLASHRVTETFPPLTAHASSLPFLSRCRESRGIQAGSEHFPFRYIEVLHCIYITSSSSQHYITSQHMYILCIYCHLSPLSSQPSPHHFTHAASESYTSVFIEEHSPSASQNNNTGTHAMPCLHHSSHCTCFSSILRQLGSARINVPHSRRPLHCRR